MAQREVELILVRQLASYLTTPFLVVDTKGTLLYFNEAAEPLLGRRGFEPATLFHPTLHVDDRAGDEAQFVLAPRMRHRRTGQTGGHPFQDRPEIGERTDDAVDDDQE